MAGLSGPTMTMWEQAVTIAMLVVGTMATRFVIFYIFSGDRPTPEYIKYLGRMLPAAAFGLLVVYCFRNESLFSGDHALPELAAAACTAGLHLWRRNMLLSMAGGTIFYMALIRFVA
ncbi:MAG: branched-chain amino acid transporter permease [Planctomycetes bacterium]|nr:branched-chain amino acid transporter permease [Planctomycetota bacterium]